MPSAYAERVAHYLKGLEFVSTGLCPTCPECQSAYDVSPRAFYSGVVNGTLPNEGGFSWSPCDICGTSLGGGREPWHARDDKGRLVHGDGACVDCIMYLANGIEPEQEA